MGRYLTSRIADLSANGPVLRKTAFLRAPLEAFPTLTSGDAAFECDGCRQCDRFRDDFTKVLTWCSPGFVLSPRGFSVPRDRCVEELARRLVPVQESREFGFPVGQQSDSLLRTKKQ
jgi:hypothetical protein